MPRQARTDLTGPPTRATLDTLVDQAAPPRTPDILSRLGEWESWAISTQELHSRLAYSLQRRLVVLGMAAVALSMGDMVWLIASPHYSGRIAWTVGAVTAVAAAVAASLQTFLGYGEEAEKHRQIAERWARLRREIGDIRALDPESLAGRVDAEPDIADLRTRIEDASAKSRSVIESGRGRETAAQQRLEFRAAAIAAVGMRSRRTRRASEPRQSLFTPAVRTLLEDWERRAAASSDAHVAVGQRVSSLNIRLGVPAVVLLLGVATFLLVRGDAAPTTASRLGLTAVCTFAAISIALNTFLRTAERAAKHGIAAEMWAAVRGEIADVTRDPPRRVQEDPKSFLDDLRRRMDEVSARSPAVGDGAWTRTLSSETRRPPGSATDAADRFAALFPGVNLRVDDDAMEAAS
jgi:hypothetical protein